MTMPKFDTQEYVKRLTAAGMPPDQAAAQAQTLMEALSESTVTPAELLLLRIEMTARLDTLKAEFGARIDAVRSELEIFKANVKAKFTTLFWLVGLTLAMQGVTIGLLIHLLKRLP